METTDAKGLVIFLGTFAFYAFILLGYMEHRLKNLDRIIKQAEDDEKYVN